MIQTIDMGLIDYGEAYNIQKGLVAKRKLGEIEDTLILAEHKSIFTIGRTGREENLLADKESLEKEGIKVLRVDRGGDITFHGPGQLVIYPIIDLKARQRDLHTYLRDLEEVIIRFLRQYLVLGLRRKGYTGVWINDRKIASIGVASSNWITYHGASINLNMDLEPFSRIYPCGIRDARMTSLADILNKGVDLEQAKGCIKKQFDAVFSRPPWLKKRLIQNAVSFETKRALRSCGTNTVCESSLCPNLNECFSRRTATFLILGNSCTRKCAFCSMEKGIPQSPEPVEPEMVAAAVKRLGLKYAVITSVTRDDLEDGGAGQFVKTIEAVRGLSAGIKIEVLVPDFRGDMLAVKKILDARPDVFGHNMETVRRLYPEVRRGADYERSLEVLRFVKNVSPGQITKSGIMSGLGEMPEEIMSAIIDIKNAGCDILTIGQYLRPTLSNIEIKRFVLPEEFDRYKNEGSRLGFKHVASGPFVRSSYLADIAYKMTGDNHERCYTAAIG